MISKQHIRKLIAVRMKDADALLNKRRYHGTIYMSGYAVELALKYRICMMYRFTKGFPENQSEFRSYSAQVGKRSPIRQAISDIRQIRNHDLSMLLQYSGEELNIQEKLPDEWTTIIGWNPEMRYKISVVRKASAVKNMIAIRRIINLLK